MHQKRTIHQNTSKQTTICHEYSNSEAHTYGPALLYKYIMIITSRIHASTIFLQLITSTLMFCGSSVFHVATKRSPHRIYVPSSESALANKPANDFLPDYLGTVLVSSPRWSTISGTYVTRFPLEKLQSLHQSPLSSG